MAEPSRFHVSWLERRPPEDLELARSLAPSWMEVEAVPLGSDGLPAAQDRGRLATAQALLVQRSPVSERLLALAPRVRLVQLYGVRDEGIDREAARRRGIQVSTTHLRGCIAVAELAMTLVLALSKSLLRADRLTREGAYRELDLEPRLTDQRSHAFQWMGLAPLFEVRGRRLGIYGLGEIGTELALRARAFGMEVGYTKRRRLPGPAERRLGVRWMEPDALFRGSDFVALTLPYAPDVHHLVGARELALMPESTYLVNVARGPLVDEAALARALERGEIAGAALDVFELEPLPQDSPLTRSPRVLLTPHIGGGSGGAREKQLADVLAAVASFAEREGREVSAVQAGGESHG